jgi:hypothetical protein
MDQARKKSVQRMCLLDPLLNRSKFSIRKGVILDKQLIRLIMNYACHALRSAACTHVLGIQVLQSKFLGLVTGAPCYLSNRRIHEDLGVPIFADHIGACL